MALPTDFGLQFESKKRAAAGQRDATLATNAYSRFLAQDRGSRDLVKLNRGMNQGVEKLSTSFGRRGLAHSGIFNQGQSDYTQNWLTQQNDIQGGIDGAARQAGLADSLANSNYSNSIADIEAQKQAQIAADAAQLAAFHPFL